MKRFSNWRVALILCAAAFCVLAVLTIPLPIVHGEFSKQVSITGGTPAKRLSTAMVAAGYTGPAALDEITICNLDTNAATVYLGQPPTTTDGYPLAPGDCQTYHAEGRPVDSSSMYIYTAATQSVAVTLRQR